MDFKIGDRIEHKKLGKGTVVEGLSTLKGRVDIVFDKDKGWTWSVFTSNLTKVEETKESEE